MSLHSMPARGCERGHNPGGECHCYAGGFPTGPTVVTTTFDDGRTRRDEMPNLGF